MAIGGLAGVLVGVSAAAYWAIAVVAAVGALLSGFEHTDGWDAADRGFLSGLIYGTALLLAHELAGTQAKASLGSVPALLAVVTTLAGMLLAAAGGQLARARRAGAAAGPSGAPAQRL
ncbi:MAG TPA: hypothetical protein VG325_08280 [Solirubrobacteraceae bacterium]|jgi:hypothetical protein|nr:hypothetical protein [Solirubrobacteraceae bacterium]